MEGKKVHDLVQMTLSKKNKTNPGGKIEDPIINLKIDFAPFPLKYPHKFLIGQPKSQFFDARTRFIDDQGREQYKPAMVENEDGKEELVSEKNIHKFITKGSKIIKGKVMMPSVVASEGWLSLPITIVHAVIMPGANDGFSDEVVSTTDSKTVKDAINAEVSSTASSAVGNGVDAINDNKSNNASNSTSETHTDTQKSGVANKDEVDDALNALN